MNVFKPLRSRARSSLIGAALLGLCALLPLSAHAGTATYKYDNLGRLTEISYDTGVVLKYGYDAAGNRSTELVTGTGVLSPEVKAALIAILMLLLDD
jgi:YD repeat-containing protein